MSPQGWRSPQRHPRLSMSSAKFSVGLQRMVARCTLRSRHCRASITCTSSISILFCNFSEALWKRRWKAQRSARIALRDLRQRLKSACCFSSADPSSKKTGSWGLHLVRCMYPQMFQEKEWELFIGEIVGSVDGQGRGAGGKSSGGSSSRSFPDWAAPDRAGAFDLLETNFPRFVSNLQLHDSEIWGKWSRSPECESAFSKRLGRSKLSPFRRCSLSRLFDLIGS